jgi:RimJ/RimL family protein N-acetyltransferase
VRPLALDELSRLAPLFERYRFNPYRNYKAFTQAEQINVLRAEAEAALSESYSCGTATGEDDLIGTVLVRRLPWDTAFFGIPMARIDRILGDERAACDATLAAALAGLRKAGLRHVAARIDVADLPNAALLEDHGFHLAGSLTTYVARMQDPPDAVRTRGTIRPIQDADGPELIAIARDAFHGFRSRFHADGRFPQERADALYPEWARRCVTRELAEMVLVAESKTRGLLGFTAFRRVEPISTTARRPVFGGGIGACRRDAPGAYAGLTRAAMLWAQEHGGIAEAQTPADNFAAIAVFEKVGLRLRRTEYVFHLWLD